MLVDLAYLSPGGNAAGVRCQQGVWLVGCLLDSCVPGRESEVLLRRRRFRGLGARKRRDDWQGILLPLLLRCPHDDPENFADSALCHDRQGLSFDFVDPDDRGGTGLPTLGPGYRLYVRQRLGQATSGVRVTDGHPTVGWPALHRGLCGRRVAQQSAPAARRMRATVASRGKDDADQSVQQAALHALGATRTLRTGGPSAVRYLIHGTSVAWRTRVVRAVPHPACKLPPRLPSACM